MEGGGEVVKICPKVIIIALSRLFFAMIVDSSIGLLAETITAKFLNGFLVSKIQQSSGSAVLLTERD